MIKRIQSFEFNDLEATPRFVRESIVEILGNGLRLGRVLEPAAPLFMEFCRRAGSDQVLDLCSGTGEPVSIFFQALEKKGFDPPGFVLSDLLPNLEAMERVRARHGTKIQVEARSVDATNVPKEIDRPARTIINAFHHFPEGLAAAILADCVAKRRAVFILEGFTRRPARFLPLMPFLVGSHFINPFVASRDRTWKFLFTYVLPLISACGSWDAVVSFLRTRNREDMLELVAPLAGGFTWQHHEVPFFPGGRIQVFMGFPV